MVPPASLPSLMWVLNNPALAFSVKHQEPLESISVKEEEQQQHLQAGELLR